MGALRQIHLLGGRDGDRWQISKKPQGGVVSWGRLGLQLSAAGTL